ncbi:hypothetical protein [Pseudonocardia abyssalis]|uniref:hypothetical protein n=1 Tax=Pseudonocardia abyssalis TaxID=2792008 RepID=UPI001CF6456F|nr:hypothetical protein [Pseudonocardia abyssalis]
MLTATGLGVVLPMLLLTTAGDPEPPGCAVSDSHGRCLVIAVDPGRPGRPSNPDREEASTRPETDEGIADDDAGTSSEPERPRLQALPFGDGSWVRQEVPDPADFLDALPADTEPAIDPATIAQVLAQRAVEQLTLDPPEPRTSADGPGYVGVPVWLWIEDGVASTGPVSATATVGAARVTATGRLSAVEWSMGPAGADVRCTGPGTPWTGQAGSSPDCGYTYEQRSLPERTGGTGRWTVIATSVWTVMWTGVSGGLPVAGEETVRVSAETSLGVGEIQVLVGGER